jgi:hypothetical protein
VSTNINITVGDNALLDAARQQQVANRQGQLQKEASLRLEAQATAARTTALAAQGRDANGNPIFGAHLSQPQIERRPTANRQQSFDYGQGYFNAFAVDSVGVTNIMIRSGDKTVVFEEVLEGTGQPVGYRNRAGADALPPLEAPSGADPSETLPYFWVKTVESDFVYGPGGILLSYKITTDTAQQTGVRKFADGSTVNILATTASTGGWGQFGSDVTSNLTILPAGKDLAIFAYTEARHSYKTYSLTLETIVDIVTRNAGGTFDTETSGSVSSTVMQTTEEESVIKVAYLVGKDFIKKIDYPEILYDRVLSSKRYVELKLIGESVTASWPIGGGAAGFGVANGVWFSEDMEEVPPNLNETQQLMSEWGEVKEDGYSTDYSVSPGIYSAIQAGITPVAPPASYESIKNLLPAIGQNFKWFQVFESNETQELRRYTGSLPEFYGDIFDETKFKRVKNISYEVQPGELIYYYRWNDWGSRSYCRGQALAFGFTSADLTP